MQSEHPKRRDDNSRKGAIGCHERLFVENNQSGESPEGKFDEKSVWESVFPRNRENQTIVEEETLWIIYNTIREVESAFRCLKTDLDLRPVFHKNDDAALAHLYLGLLAYSPVNTIRYQLKAKGIHHGRQEIVRITNTQKVVTTYGKNTFDETIYVRRCTEPNEKVKTIYQALEYRNYSFVKRKSVVHKSELKKNQFPYLQQINDG